MNICLKTAVLLYTWFVCTWFIISGCLQKVKKPILLLSQFLFWVTGLAMALYLVTYLIDVIYKNIEPNYSLRPYSVFSWLLGVFGRNLQLVKNVVTLKAVIHNIDLRLWIRANFLMWNVNLCHICVQHYHVSTVDLIHAEFCDKTSESRKPIKDRFSISGSFGYQISFKFIIYCIFTSAIFSKLGFRKEWQIFFA